MTEFTLNIDVDDRVTISVDVNRAASSQSGRTKKKPPTAILSNLDEESLMNEVKKNILSINKHKTRRSCVETKNCGKKGELSLNIDDDVSKYSDKSLTSLCAQKSTISAPKRDDKWIKKALDSNNEADKSLNRFKGPLRFEVVDITSDPEPELPVVTVDSFTDIEATKLFEEEEDDIDSVVEVTLSDANMNDFETDENLKCFDPIYRTHRLFPLENNSNSLTGKLDSLFSSVFAREVIFTYNTFFIVSAWLLHQIVFFPW